MPDKAKAMATETPLSDVREEHHQSTSALEVERRILGGNEKITLLDLLILLAERKRTILTVAATFAVIAIIVSLLLPKRYTARVTLMPPQQNSSLGAAFASQLGSLGGMAALAGTGLGIKNPNDMYVAMLKSRIVEDAMVEKFGLMQEYDAKYLSDARLTFEKRATVTGDGKDNLIHIAFEDSDPNRAAAIANGYVDQYRRLSEHLAITEASQRRLFFEQQLEQSKNNLVQAEEALKRTEQTTGLIELSSQSRALIESAAALRAQITSKQVQIESMQTYATGQNAQLIQAQQELDSLKAQLARLGGTEDSAEGGGLIVPKGKVPQAGLEYVRKFREVKYNETVFEILARQFELAKLDEAREGALIQVVDPAVPPDKRSFPKRGLIVIGATAVGFLFGMLLALLQASYEHLRSDPATSHKIYQLNRLFSFRRSRSV
jgi:uncharacterized protein involved in exopolysaccharide biosynthesis